MDIVLGLLRQERARLIVELAVEPGSDVSLAAQTSAKWTRGSLKTGRIISCST